MCPVKVKESLLDHASVGRILSCGNTIYSQIILVITCKMHGFLAEPSCPVSASNAKQPVYRPPQTGTDKWSICCTGSKQYKDSRILLLIILPRRHYRWFFSDSVTCKRRHGALFHFSTQCCYRLVNVWEYAYAGGWNKSHLKAWFGAFRRRSETEPLGGHLLQQNFLDKYLKASWAL